MNVHVVSHIATQLKQYSGSSQGDDTYAFDQLKMSTRLCQILKLLQPTQVTVSLLRRNLANGAEQPRRSAHQPHVQKVSTLLFCFDDPYSKGHAIVLIKNNNLYSAMSEHEPSLLYTTSSINPQYERCITLE